MGSNGRGRDSSQRHDVTSPVTGDVIRVGMGQQDSVHAVPRGARGVQPQPEFARAKAGVEQQAKTMGDQQAGIAAAAARQHGKLYGHPFTPPARVPLCAPL